MKPIIKNMARFAAILVAGSIGVAQQPTSQERIVALKSSLAASQAILKGYEWIEATTINVKGETKSTQQERCYYGADGKVQKVPVVAPPPPEKRRGIRGRIAERKKEEMTDYMKSAVGLVKQYLPPDPAKIQAAKDAGKLSVQPLPNNKVSLTFADYLKAGDSLALDVDLNNNHPVEAKVSTYMDSPKDPVTLDVKFGTLDNNATYASTIVLDAKAKDLQVAIGNTGYRPAGR